MMQVVVESLGAFRAASHDHRDREIIWRTTSPELLEKISSEGGRVCSLEQELDPETQRAIGRAAIKSAKALSRKWKNKFPGKNSAEILQSLNFFVPQTFFILAYKGYLLDQICNKGPFPVLVVGRSRPDPMLEGRPIFGRFETIYAQIAAVCRLPFLRVFEFAEDSVKNAEQEKYVKHRKMSIWEKLLSISTNTAASFCFKLWKKFSKATGVNSITWTPFPRANIYLHKECELIEEGFLKILFSGSRLRNLQRLPGLPAFEGAPEHLAAEDSVALNIEREVLKIFEKEGVPAGAAFRAAVHLAIGRVLTCCNGISGCQELLERAFEKILAPLQKGGFILTNMLASPVENLFAMHCGRKNIEIVACEHGITWGLSRFTQTIAEYAGILATKTAVYHWEKSLEDLRPFTRHQTILLGGVPEITKNPPFYGWHRGIGRKLLGIRPKEHLVMYVADLERNNYLWGPFVENDFQYWITTKEIMRTLSKLFPRSVVLLKLYPTHRYPDSYDFSALAAELPNVRVIKDVEFRFLRAAADLIALSSAQSTLGWALGARCPVWFFEKEASPVHVPGEDLGLAVAGVRRVLQVEMDLSSQNQSWVRDMLAVMLRKKTGKTWESKLVASTPTLARPREQAQRPGFISAKAGW